MKRRLFFILGVIALFLLPSLPVSGQDNPPNNLLRLLKFVPDTPNDRQWVTYGDEAAWLQSWAIPRIDNVDQLKALDRDPRAYWMFILPYQTAAPEVMGLNYLLSDNQRSFYGFDFFNVDRYLAAGMPLEDISVVEFGFDSKQIADALTATGYTSESLEGGGTLYSILQDGQSALGQAVSLPRVGMLGELNRIALLNGQMVIARATVLVENSLKAQQGGAPSLADDPAYIAAAQALDDPSLSDTGDLVGAILIQSTMFADPAQLLNPNMSVTAVLEAMRKQFGDVPLPPFTLVTFATRHKSGATYLILDVVFPAGTDAKAASGILSERLQKYVSLVTKQPLSERWTFDRLANIEVNGLPVALVTMRVDDPPVAAAGEIANTGILGWLKLVQARDLGFLLTGSLGG